MPYKYYSSKKAYMVKYRKLHKEQLSQYNKEYHKVYNKLDRVRVENSRRLVKNPDMSPILQNKLDLSIDSAKKLINKYKAAKPQALKNNKYSHRKGVSYRKDKHVWEARLYTNRQTYRAFFKTEQDAVQYRIELENKYFTKEQLKIRDKYSEE